MQTFDCKVTTHGRHQIELNTIYPVDREKPHTQYQVDAFFFVPFQLGLAKYRVGDVLRDLRSYVRFAPTPIALSRLVDPQCDLSPLTRIRQLLSRTTLAHDLDPERLLYEIRALVNIFHAQIRESRVTFRHLAEHPLSAAEVSAFITRFLDELREFLSQFRSLHTDFLDARILDLLRAGLNWADESISLKAEKELYHIQTLFRSHPEVQAELSRLKIECEREQQYRQRQKYLTVIDPGNAVSGETFLYRESMLKKWAQSAMYIEAKPRQLGAQIGHIVAGIAAAAAMAFAVVSAFLAGKLFALYSLPWVILIVLSYIFKDRIKEILRALFMTVLPCLVADDMHILLDPRDMRRAGAVKFRVRFCRPDSMPHLVTRLRNLEANPFRHLSPPEDVLHLQVDMRLECHQLAQHMRLEAISHILRLKLNSWLTNMDEPCSPIDYMQNGEPHQVQACRVYHVHLIIRLRSGHGQDPGRYLHYRVILNRDGIVRIDGMASNGLSLNP